MLRDKMCRSLHHLGIDNTNYKVLKLLPLVYVAWADGKLEMAEEKRLIELAHDHFKIGPGGEKVLKHWIAERPSLDYFKEGLHDVLLLAQAPDDWEFDLDELQGLLAHAEAIARTTAEAMDAPTAVDENEQRALRDIAQELGVDDGESWAELMSELATDDGARPS